MEQNEQQPPQWMAHLDERTNKHVAFARNYVRNFGHGAPGHLDLTTINSLAKLLDDAEFSANNPLIGTPPQAE